MSPSVTFYGHFSGHGSYVVVCVAILETMRSWGFDVTPVDLRTSPPRADGAVDAASVALLFGFPEWWSRISAGHRARVGYHVPNHDELPNHWPAFLGGLDAIVTPSAWCAAAFKRSGFDATVVPHGIDPEVFTAEGDDPRGPVGTLSFYHFCSAADPDRKGTLELIKAWDSFATGRDDAHLYIVGRPDVVAARVEQSPRQASIFFEDREGYFYGRQQRNRYCGTHFVIAPSRAEGFGLCPLESLACGVPILATQCTGHAEWAPTITAGALWIPHGELAPCSPPPGRAPTVAALDILEGLFQARAQYARLRREALGTSLTVRARWCWARVLLPLQHLLLNL